MFQCYECGGVVSAEQVQRRQIASGKTSAGQTVYSKENLCPGCAQAYDVWDEAHWYALLLGIGACAAMTGLLYLLHGGFEYFRAWYGWLLVLAVPLLLGYAFRRVYYTKKLSAQPPVLVSPLSAEGHPVEPSGMPIEPGAQLQPGSRVLAFEQDRWWRVEVLALESDDRVRIHFVGWDARWDKSVPLRELQRDCSGAEESTSS